MNPKLPTYKITIPPPPKIPKNPLKFKPLGIPKKRKPNSYKRTLRRMRRVI